MTHELTRLTRFLADMAAEARKQMRSRQERRLWNQADYEQGRMIGYRSSARCVGLLLRQVKAAPAQHSETEIGWAVTQHCTCGGGGPHESHTCPACHVYHALVTTPKMQVKAKGDS